MVGNHCKHPPIEILVEMFYSVDECQSFFLQLCVIPLCRGQGPGCKCHWSLTAIGVDMRDNGAYPVSRSIGCQLNRKLCIIVSQHLGGYKVLLSSLESFGAFRCPLPANVLSEELIEWVDDGSQVGNKLRIIVQQSQKRAKLLLILWFWCLDNRIHFAGQRV